MSGVAAEHTTVVDLMLPSIVFTDSRHSSGRQVPLVTWDLFVWGSEEVTAFGCIVGVDVLKGIVSSN